jgi:hypothetical protein
MQFARAMVPAQKRIAMTKKTKIEVVEVVQPTMASGIESEVPATDAPAPKKAKKPKPADASLTLEDLAAKYLQHLEDAGKSNGTLFSYKLELITALDELGAKTLLADLTPTRVLEYFVSDRVTRTRAGVQKAKPTIDKCRRVLRMALQWAEDSGLVAQAPLPEASAPY